MYPIVQKDPFGCGIACVAFVSNRDYTNVASLFKKSQAQSRGFSCRELQTCLSKFGLRYSYKYIKSKLMNHIYADLVIVFIKRSTRYPSGHYLVRLQGRWMDPWINICKNSNVEFAKSGFRKRLPGKPIYALIPARNDVAHSSPWFDMPPLVD